MMSINSTASPNMWLETTHSRSDRCLDSLPLAPSRLPSPSGKEKKTTSLSPDGVGSLLEITVQLNDLLGNLSSRKEGNERQLGAEPNEASEFFSRRKVLTKEQSSSQSIISSDSSIPTLMSQMMSPERTMKETIEVHDRDLRWKLSNPMSPDRPKLASEIFHLKSSHRRNGSDLTFDSIPELPSRMVSPVSGEKGQVEISGKTRDFFVNTLPALFHVSGQSEDLVVDAPPSPLDKEEAPGLPQVEAPTNPTSSVASTILVGKSKGNVRDEILERIPNYVKNLLTKEEWYRILEPSLKVDRMETHSVCSDITEDWLVDRMETHSVCSDITEDDWFDEPTEQERMLDGIEDFVQESLRWEPNYPTKEETKTRDMDERNESSMIEETKSLSDSDLHSTEVEDIKKDTGVSIGLVQPNPHAAVYEETKEETKEETLGGYHDSPSAEEDSIVLNQQCEAGQTVPHKQKRRVSFGTARVRWHERILEMHPCTSSGPSVGIGWEYYSESEEPISWGAEAMQRKRDGIRLSRGDREEIVTKLGYSAQDIASVVGAIREAKNQRRRTLHNLTCNFMKVEKVELIYEELKDKLCIRK